MQFLSTRTREAIKTGLAMALAYGVALAMDWERPYWAGFAVAFISLSTTGQSLNKGAMRMVGTGLAAVAALLLLAWFPQYRFALLGGLAAWVGFCSYMMTGPRRSYFWFVAGFVCIVIVVDSQADPSTAFHVMVARTLETGLGIGVYTLVSVFLWPQNSARALEDTVHGLFTTQVGLFRSYLELTENRGTHDESRPQRLQQAELLGRLAQMLEAAETDTYEIWEARRAWRRFVALSKSLSEALEGWRVSLPDARGLELAAVVPNLPAALGEVGDRLTAIEQTLAGEAPAPGPEPRKLDVDPARLAALSHFDRAAVALIRREVERLRDVSRDLLDCVRAIRGLAPLGALRAHEPASRSTFFDLDRVEASLRVVTNLCLAFAIWIYVDPPGHASFVMMAPIIAMAAATMPTLSPLSLFGPFALGCGIAGGVYLLVMPHLVGYGQLGPMIFGVTAGVYYVFYTPSHALAKLGAMIPFLSLTSISNSQTYSFAGYANSVAMIGLIIVLANVTAYLPPSPRPEKRFLRLVTRFFRLAERAVSGMSFDARERRESRGLDAELLGLPLKLQTWGARIDHASFPGARPAQVQGIVSSLHLLAHRIEALRAHRGDRYPEALVDHLLGDIRAWRRGLQDGLRQWSEEPGRDLGKDVTEHLAARLEALERRTAEALELDAVEETVDRGYESFYTLLASYRGLAEAMLAHANATRGVDLTAWREARF